MPRGTPPITLVHRSRTGRVRLRCPSLRGNPRGAERLTLLLGRARIGTRPEVRAGTGSIVMHVPPDREAPALLSDLLPLLAQALGRAPLPEDLRAPRAADTEDDGPAWFAHPPEVLERRLGTDLAAGLSTAEAERRFRRHGPNRLPQEERRSPVSLFAEQFQSLPVAMLAGSAGSRLMLASFPLAFVGFGDGESGFSFATVLGLNASLDYARMVSEHLLLGQAVGVSVAQLGPVDDRSLPIGELHGLIVNAVTHAGYRP